jgi:hypothetical protein
MKRFVLGVGWCFLIWLGSLMIAGAVLGAIAGASAGDPTTGAQAGQRVGAEFGRHYGGLFLLGSIAVSAIGTVTGWLPGTRPETS